MQLVEVVIVPRRCAGAEEEGVVLRGQGAAVDHMDRLQERLALLQVAPSLTSCPITAAQTIGIEQVTALATAVALQ